MVFHESKSKLSYRRPCSARNTIQTIKKPYFKKMRRYLHFTDTYDSVHFENIFAIFCLNYCIIIKVNVTHYIICSSGQRNNKLATRLQQLLRAFYIFLMLQSTYLVGQHNCTSSVLKNSNYDILDSIKKKKV